MWRVVASMDQPMILPSFPDAPAAGPEVGVTLPIHPGHEAEPKILPFPTALSGECVAPAVTEETTLLERLFAEDPLFKTAA